MKKQILLTAVMMMSMHIFAQSEFKEKTIFKNSDVEIHQIDAHTWHGNGHLVYNESIYLIEGDTAALLIDAGTRIPGLRKIVEDIVKKPVTLVATHVHGDHTGSAIDEWESIWLNIADTVNIPKNYRYKGEMKRLTDGQKFELGGRTIEVVFTAGHTPGSVTYIDKANHYGFSGDAFGSGNLLVFDQLSTVVTSSEKMTRVIEAYGITHLYPGHYWGNNLETPKRVKDVGTICQDIISGRQQPTGKGGNGLAHMVERDGVKINYRK